MRKFGRLLGFGFLSWLLTFAGSLCLSPFRDSQRTTFETLIGIVLTASTVLFTLLYFRKISTSFLREGLLLGAAFVFCNILFDLPMFLSGPMQMPLAEYMKDIGLAYLSMPLITLAIGYTLQKQDTQKA